MSGKEKFSRSEWLDCFKTGFQLGKSERKRSPEKRRSDAEEVIADRRGYGPYSDVEMEAVQAGYDLGRKKAFPGANIDIEQEANTAYDKSGHAPGLSQWVEDGNE